MKFNLKFNEDQAYAQNSKSSTHEDIEMPKIMPLENAFIQNKNKLPTYSQEYILSTIYHEILHAYMFSKLSKGPDGKYNISAQHEDMANKYVTLITGALKIAFPNISDQEAWGLSWED
ncbi:hypothetical protein ACTJKC_22190 [Pedobacter sp. 22226]|uniref:hypothetical protein n=1 Tax=Pedobacter sp. 22226 TaxID=3453894 RepID=UPI003F871411